MYGRKRELLFHHRFVTRSRFSFVEQDRGPHRTHRRYKYRQVHFCCHQDQITFSFKQFFVCLFDYFCSAFPVPLWERSSCCYRCHRLQRHLVGNYYNIQQTVKCSPSAQGRIPCLWCLAYGNGEGATGVSCSIASLGEGL